MTQEEINKAAKEYAIKVCGCDIPDVIKSDQQSFCDGAIWLHDKGYQFTKEDMRAAYSAGAEDEYTGRTFDRWFEERKALQQEGGENA